MQVLSLNLNEVKISLCAGLQIKAFHDKELSYLHYLGFLLGRSGAMLLSKCVSLAVLGTILSCGCVKLSQTLLNKLWKIFVIKERATEALNQKFQFYPFPLDYWFLKELDWGFPLLIFKWAVILKILKISRFHNKSLNRHLCSLEENNCRILVFFRPTGEVKIRLYWGDMRKWPNKTWYYINHSILVCDNFAIKIMVWYFMFFSSWNEKTKEVVDSM